MGRVVFELLVLFLAPFVIYSLYMAIKARDPRALTAFEKGPARLLALAGMVLVVAMLIFAGISEGERTGAYRPAEFKDGVLVPGTVR